MDDRPDGTARLINFGCGALVAGAAGLPFILISFEPTMNSFLFLTGAAILVGVLAAIGGEDVLERSLRIAAWLRHLW